MPDDEPDFCAENAKNSTPDPELVERIARIVDPGTWHDRDAYVLIMLKNGGCAEEVVMEIADRRVRDSLATANAIIAALQSDRSAVLEEAARCAENEKSVPYERRIPAHTETNDYGEPVMEVPERVMQMKRLPSAKSIATAIRALKAPSHE